MSDIRWIQIVTDIFDNRKIRQIEKMPEGDSLIVIWFKILTLAGSTNENGVIFLTRDIPFTEETLAIQFDRPINTIRLALETFQQLHMIDIVNDFIHVTNWEKYQNVEGMDRVRELNKLRKQRQRERQKQALLEEVTGMSRDQSRDVTQQNKNKNIDIDIEKELKTPQPPAQKVTLSFLIDEQDFSPQIKDVLKEWVQYKIERGDKYKTTGFNNLITHIRNNVNEYGDAAVEEAIRYAMSQNWVGMNLERLKENRAKNRTVDHEEARRRFVNG